MELYLSSLLGIQIVNKEREKIGTLADFVITDITKAHPRIQGVLLARGRGKGRVFIPIQDVGNISTKEILLTTSVVNLESFTPQSDDILLTNDIYDKQIVDIDDRRLTRVNDLQLEYLEKTLRLKGVDVSMLGISKRLHIPEFFHLLKRNVIDWEDVQFLGGQTPMKFNVQYKNLESLHPIDIARIIFEGPGYKQGSRVLASLKDPIAADIIEELSPKLQQNLIESMKIEDVVDVVNQMPAHKAADLLLALGSSYSEKIITKIEPELASEIRSLLNYPEHSTGAYMTTDYLASASNLTVDEVYASIRKQEEQPDFTMYIYMLENERSNKLVGVISLSELIIADRRQRAESIMMDRLVYAHPHDTIKDTLKKMYRYNISGIPVVTKTDHKLLGIVTFRDAVSIFLPRRFKLRIRRVFSNNN